MICPAVGFAGFSADTVGGVFVAGAAGALSPARGSVIQPAASQEMISGSARSWACVASVSPSLCRLPRQYNVFVDVKSDFCRFGVGRFE